MSIKTKIESKKKILWDKYPTLINNNFDAFELMREVGNLQGKYKIIEEVEKMIDKMEDEENLQKYHVSYYRALEQLKNKLMDKKE